MPYARDRFRGLSGLVALLLSAHLPAQQQPPGTSGAPPAKSSSVPAQSSTAPAQQSPATAPSQTLSSSLGVFVFAAKNQSAQQQNTDEAACFSWAKTQTGIDPMTLGAQTAPAQPKADEQAASQPGKRSAVRGAAGGAAIGAIAGDAGTGAAAGAAAGAMKGGREKRKAAEQQEAAKQQEAAAAQQAQAQVADQKAKYNKAFSACLEGKGYTVK